ncbi:superoxide dismutase [Fe], putative (SOD2) [Plasmodium ovale curtisi]|uniref:superoxide dismutase n=1 Tax=Plasmodium ovale curtisi TaxID=864141 RepID=A0A1A8X4E8_PLAOA|nr:superoxide dismutase [Fe], putative (SOD2) [Plasmodium ovale curtisi]
MNVFTTLSYFLCVVFLLGHGLFRGINGLKNTCKLSYIKISSFPSPLTKNSNRRFSKSDESLYEDWDVQSLWTSKPFSLMKLPFVKTVLKKKDIKTNFASNELLTQSPRHDPIPESGGDKVSLWQTPRCLRQEFEQGHHAVDIQHLAGTTALQTEPIIEHLSRELAEIIEKYEGPIYNNAGKKIVRRCIYAVINFYKSRTEGGGGEIYVDAPLLFDVVSQIFNHNFFWLGIKADGGGKPYGVVKDKIEESFISFENFREIFLKEASAHFGSGWTWLIMKDEKLKLYHGHDADNPIKSKVGHPILTIDIWEHAYYVDYKNSRSDYIKEWFNKVNWDFANYNLSIAN